MPNLKPLRGSFPNLSHPDARGLFLNYLMNAGSGNQVFDYSRNGNIGTIDGATRVSGKFGHELNFTTDDEVTFPITKFANLETGTISIIFKVPPDSGNQAVLFAVSAAAGPRSEFDVILNYGVGAQDNAFQIFFIKDNVTQWEYRSTDNTLDPFIGQYIRVTVTHNGITPAFYLNDILMGGSFQISLNLTDWFKAIITDATNKADTGNLGLLRVLGGEYAPFEGNISDCTIWNYARSADQVARYYFNPYAMFDQVSPIKFAIPSAGRISRYHNLNGLAGQGQVTHNPLG